MRHVATSLLAFLVTSLSAFAGDMEKVPLQASILANHAILTQIGVNELDCIADVSAFKGTSNKKLQDDEMETAVFKFVFKLQPCDTSDPGTEGQSVDYLVILREKAQLTSKNLPTDKRKYQLLSVKAQNKDKKPAAPNVLDAQSNEE